MNLVWKLLRQHLSIPQFAGFFFANLFGMLVVLLGVQFYKDVAPVFTSEDSFISKDYLIISKHISSVSTLSGRSNTFNDHEIKEAGRQPFCKNIGAFTSSQYKVSASMGVKGNEPFTTEMFFEAVPNGFVDAHMTDWTYNIGEKEIPIILPRNYLALYNFGFAQSHGLPKVSEGLVGLIDMTIFINGNGKHDQYKGKIIGFSGRLNTILVPQSFIEWSNKYYTQGQEEEPSRIILEVNNPTDQRIQPFMAKHNYEVEDNKLDAGKTTYFLKMVVGLVMFVGFLISVLSFYILMLSIYLLVQKNTTKLENLLLIGYSPNRVSFPYQMLTIGMNVIVLLLSFLFLSIIRNYYMEMILLVFPQMDEGTMLPALCMGIILFLLVSIINAFAIRKKVMSIWYRKE
ncbi:MAG: ABC transporter permease [Bacteroidaceae bacterium]